MAVIWVEPLTIALYHDPTSYCFRQYRAQVGSEVRWYSLRQDAERWIRVTARHLAGVPQQRGLAI